MSKPEFNPEACKAAEKVLWDCFLSYKEIPCSKTWFNEGGKEMLQAFYEAAEDAVHWLQPGPIPETPAAFYADPSCLFRPLTNVMARTLSCMLDVQDALQLVVNFYSPEELAASGGMIIKENTEGDEDVQDTP